MGHLRGAPFQFRFNLVYESMRRLVSERSERLPVKSNPRLSFDGKPAAVDSHAASCLPFHGHSFLRFLRPLTRGSCPLLVSDFISDSGR